MRIIKANHRRSLGLAWVVVFASLAPALSCGGSGSFSLSSGDNDSGKLAEAFAKVQPPGVGPVNRDGRPMVFLAARGKPKQLVAFDLEAKKERWRVPSDLRSKVVVGRDFVAVREGDASLVGRDISTGKQLWTVELDGSFVGAASDTQNVYFTIKSQNKTWVLHAVDGVSGKSLWDVESSGALGTPAARGGLVFSPFLKQWLAILDARTGVQITRIRGIDEEISFVRTTPSQVYFGSKNGVFLLDERAASGKRSQSTYGRAKFPKYFKRAHYSWDAFDPVQAGYSAYDRNRVLWNADAKDGALIFTHNLVAVQNYRFFFGFSADSGKLLWAYNHPRVDVVASAQLGDSIGMVSMLGEIGALDPLTGEKIYQAKVPGQFLGGTFDASGWKPNDRSGERGSTAAALASIARDRDARFNDVKKFAVTALSQLEGREVTRDLLALIQNEKTPAYLVQTGGEVLIGRKDVEGLGYLVDALSLRQDYVEGSSPRGVGIVARSIAALDCTKVEASLRAKAVAALTGHLWDPATTSGSLEALVRALGRVGDGVERATLRSFLLTYRADPAFAKKFEPIAAAVDVLLERGGAQDRETVSFVAADKRTLPIVAQYASAAIMTPRTTRDSKPGLDKQKAGDTPPAKARPSAAENSAQP